MADSSEPAIAKWAKERLLEDADAQRRATEALADEKRRARNRALAPFVVVLLVIVVALLVHFSAGSADP